jgi:Tol biopolymer transport system component
MIRLTAMLICICLAASACASGGGGDVGNATDLIGHESGTVLPRLRHGNELVMLESDYVGGLVGYNPATHATRMLVPCASCTNGRWSPDGRWLAYDHCNPTASSLCTPDLGLWAERAGAPPRRLSGALIWWAWAPRGATLATMSKPHRGTTTIALINPATGRSRILARVRPPFGGDIFWWSPDGTKIAFHLGTNLKIVPTHGGAAATIPVPGMSSTDYYPDISWSPDSRRIAITVKRGGPPSVYVVSTSGTPAPLRLGPGRAALWSPDGHWISFWDRGGIWTVTPDGSRRVRLGSDGRPGDMMWSPTGTRLGWSPVGGPVSYDSRPGHSGEAHKVAPIQFAKWTEAPSRVYLEVGTPILP